MHEALMLEPAWRFIRPEWLESVRQEIPEYAGLASNCYRDTSDGRGRKQYPDCKSWKTKEIGNRSRDFALKWHSAFRGMQTIRWNQRASQDNLCTENSLLDLQWNRAICKYMRELTTLLAQPLLIQVAMQSLRVDHRHGNDPNVFYKTPAREAKWPSKSSRPKNKLC